MRDRVPTDSPEFRVWLGIRQRCLNPGSSGYQKYGARGITMGLADAIIAATCLVHGLTLVTLNVADFEKVEGLALETVP